MITTAKGYGILNPVSYFSLYLFLFVSIFFRGKKLAYAKKCLDMSHRDLGLTYIIY